MAAEECGEPSEGVRIGRLTDRLFPLANRYAGYADGFGYLDLSEVSARAPRAEKRRIEVTAGSWGIHADSIPAYIRSPVGGSET